MSVLKCNRKDCENVMCDRLSHQYGYICDECYEELICLGETASISEFMNRDKKEVSWSIAEYRANEIFPYQY